MVSLILLMLAQVNHETVVVGTPLEFLDADDATSTVTRRDLERRLPRSAPDALRYEPGVFVQQTAHAQGSAYLRGLTGQQTVLLFDGIRLNNATYRQGPNQYFFTLDARALEAIEVQRGGASTRWGSDAMGGVLAARPLEPTAPTDGGVRLAPHLSFRGATADGESGLRAQLEASGRTNSGVGVAFLGGAGVRRVGLLQGPPVLNPRQDTSAGPLPWVPRYAEYDATAPFEAQAGRLRTQLGTGFGEVTADGRLVLTLPGAQRLTVAAYTYQQSDAPRTDQCPAPTAPASECLTYEAQHRHLAYAAWDGALGALAERARVTLSWQRQHERRRLDLTSTNRVDRGTDDVDTLGLTARAEATVLTVPVPVQLAVGLEQYVDLVRSRAEHEYTDVRVTVADSRGQYLDGSVYGTGGVYADARAALHPTLTARGGARLAWAWARAPGDPQSGSSAVDRAWAPLVGHLGVNWAPLPALHLFGELDRSFRAPNLDDMTARQQTGPGFQFENPALQPETALTAELGARLRLPWLQADAWYFETLLDQVMLKVSKSSADCPPATPQCLASWSRLQLQNAPASASLRGVEGAVRLSLPGRVSARATASWTWSEGPRVGELGYGVFGVIPGERVPLSRTPPLNGTVEVQWAGPWGLTVGAALQWAAAQDRLALADYSDGRIPRYGTPGFAVVHLRGAWRLDRHLTVAVVLENAFDTPWRFHGSSVNGPGRGLTVQLDAGALFELFETPPPRTGASP